MRVASALGVAKDAFRVEEMNLKAPELRGQEGRTATA
jgi:hypothetical protein